MVLQLMGTQISALLLQPGGGGPALNELQSYSLVRLAILALAEPAAVAAAASADAMVTVGAGESVGAKRGRQQDGGTAAGRVGGTLADDVAAALPLVVVNLFLTAQARHHHQHPQHQQQQWQKAERELGGQSEEVLACMELLRVSPQLAVPVLRAAAARAQSVLQTSTAVMGAAPALHSSHSADCARSSFLSATLLVQLVLRLQALRGQLVRQQGEVEAAVAAVVRHGQQDARLSGVEACAAESRRVQQIARDLFAVAYLGDVQGICSMMALAVKRLARVWPGFEISFLKWGASNVFEGGRGERRSYGSKYCGNACTHGCMYAYMPGCNSK